MVDGDRRAPRLSVAAVALAAALIGHLATPGGQAGTSAVMAAAP